MGALFNSFLMMMTSPQKSALALGVLTLLAISSATAQTVSVTVPNFSFESQTLNNGANGGNNTVTSWTGTSGQTNQVYGVEDPTTAKFAAQTDNTNTGTFNDGIADGQNAAYINTGPAANTIGTMTSAVLTTIASDTDYVLTVAVGNPLGAGTQLPGSFSLSLLADGVSVATTGLLNGNTSITDGTFADFSVTLTSAAALSVVGQNLTIQLGHDNTGGNANAQIFFDNVRLTATTTAIPEPSSYAAGLGVLALVLACRRRRMMRV